MMAKATLCARPALGNNVAADELIAFLNELAPMERLFVHQQLTDWHCGENEHVNIFRDKLTPEDVRSVFAEWRAGFSPCVIAAFESGRWKAPNF